MDFIPINAFTRKEWWSYYAAFAWAFLASDYIRSFTFRTSRSGLELEALYAFGIWALFVWWLSKRYGTGWSMYAFAVSIATFAPFADSIDASFGGVLG